MVSRPRTRRSSPRRGVASALLVAGVGPWRFGCSSFSARVLARRIRRLRAALALGLASASVFAWAAFVASSSSLRASAAVLLGALLREGGLLLGSSWRARVSSALPDLRVGQRLGAGVLLFLGELLQNDAGAALLALRPASARLPRRGLASLGFVLGFFGGLRPLRQRRSTRRFFFSTRTDLERPWLKLWRTWPDSTVRRTLSVILRSATVFAFGLVSFAHSCSVSDPCLVCKCRNALAVALDTRGCREELLSRSALDEGSMYHICPARCQTQFIRGKGADRRNGLARP